MAILQKSGRLRREDYETTIEMQDRPSLRDNAGRKHGDTGRHHLPAQDARARKLRGEAVALTINLLCL